MSQMHEICVEACSRGREYRICGLGHRTGNLELSLEIFNQCGKKLENGCSWQLGSIHDSAAMNFTNFIQF